MEAHPRGEPHRPERPKVILTQPLIRIPHRPDHPRIQIRQAPDKVDDPPLRTLTGVQRVEKQRVDREIPPTGILLRIREDHPIRAARVRVAVLAPEGRNLDRVPILGHQHDAEDLAHRTGPPEHRLDLLGRRIRRDIVILGMIPQQLVADAPPREIRDMTGIHEPTDDRSGCLTSTRHRQSVYELRCRSRLGTIPGVIPGAIPGGHSRE